MILTLALAVALAQTPPQEPAAPVDRRPPEIYRPAPATIVAEPVAVFIAACDSDRDGRTTAAELHDGIAATTRDTPRWATGIGYIAYSDWAERYLGDRNGLPSPFELDRNGDDRITLDELNDRFDAIFARFDADRDGAVTRAELLTIRTSALGRPEGERRRKR